MAQRLEITLKESLFDAEGEGIRRKAADYFGLKVHDIRSVRVLTMDADLTPREFTRVQQEVFTNPVTEVSAFTPLEIDFDWCIWVGFRPGVKDTAGETAVEAMEDVLGRKLGQGEAVYTSRRYCLRAPALSQNEVEAIANEILANDIIQQWRVFDRQQWSQREGVGIIIPKVMLDHQPQLSTLSIASDEALRTISDARNLALHPDDIPVIRAYFLDPRVKEARRRVGLEDPTDLELEYISQARSDHCNHNTFRGRFVYRDLADGSEAVFDNLFKTFIEAPTLDLKAQKPWVVSVLWDNAGVGRFDKDHFYVITGETHNSPSNMEAYGGAITGIVGVYRDPLGTGKGARLIMGGYGYCVGPRDYSGPLKPKLHPRRLLDGVIEGVRDGGNKSGIPTVMGQVTFHPGYLGKCLVFVTAVGMMPAQVGRNPSHEKRTEPGDVMIMCGGRVGKDGIHGVTASSESFSANTPAGHVQIGDPYTQKKMHDFLLEARDEDLINFITDNGGGGLSSSVGESARFSNGAEVNLDRVPLKYEGLDQWEIWVSESQERMTVAVKPEHLERFMALSAKHAVESTAIGRYSDSGKLHIRYSEQTCAYVDMDLLTAGFPQWRFEAEWQPPEMRGLAEPVMGPPHDYGRLIGALLARPNICSKEWIVRQYDHEVQGTSVIKPLVGAGRDVPSDAAVIRPVLSSERGLAYSQALLPTYSAIDTYHMTTCTIDEAVRRLVAVGGDPDHVGGVDNFCWPNIQYDPQENPDGKYKAAQLVRACQALEALCRAHEIPLLSGKDSMYVDGHLPGDFGEVHKVSALPTLQFSAVSVVADINRCVSMDLKRPGDRIYVLGMTADELGGSEYYGLMGHIGCRVPQVAVERNRAVYRALYAAINQGWVASAHGVFSGGLAVHMALAAIGGAMGVRVDLAKVPTDTPLRDDRLLFSESAGRLVVTIHPQFCEPFDALFTGLPAACVGEVANDDEFVLVGGNGETICRQTVTTLKQAWQQPFGDLV